MSTITTLAEGGALEGLTGDLSANQSAMRCLYALPDVSNEFIAIRDLNGEDAKWVSQQTDTFFNSYVSGKPFNYDKPLPSMKHMKDGIWEFKTPTLRFFGWFAFKDVFIIAKMVSKAVLIHPGTYKLAINSVIAIRHQLDLDPPKHLSSKIIHDVISV